MTIAETPDGGRPMLLGLDLAWSARNRSGAAALRSDRRGLLQPLSVVTLGTDDEILNWIEEHAADGPCVLGIDAPLIAPNEPGTGRPVDRLVSRQFGRFHAGAYPANREVAKRPVELAGRLRELGWSLDPADVAAGGRCAVEVYPHAATVALFGLDRIVKYKKGSVAQRRQGLAQFHTLLRHGLPRLDPPIAPPDPTDVGSLRGRALKDLEDRLDAWVCAAMAAVLHARPGDCEVLGDLVSGYIVVPRLPAVSFGLVSHSLR